MHAITETEFFLPEKCSDITDSEKCICFLYEDRYNVQVVKKNVVIEAADAHAITDASEKLDAGRTLPLLVDMRHVTEVSREARSVFQTRVPDSCLAVAMVVPSTIARLIANLFLAMNLMPIPIRLFNNHESAVSWLQTVV